MKKIGNEQKTTSQVVIQKIIRLIESDHIDKGSRLPSERDMVMLFGVSRASIREALSILKTLGIIEIKRGGGAYVTRFKVDTLMDSLSHFFLDYKNVEGDIMEFRRILEVGAAGLACGNPATERLKSIVEAMQLQLREASELSVGLDIDFHKEIYRMSNNSILIKAMECVEYLVDYSVSLNRGKILNASTDEKVLLKEHRSIYDAIVRQDREAAMALMSRHLDMNGKKSERKQDENCSLYQTGSGYPKSENQ